MSFGQAFDAIATALVGFERQDQETIIGAICAHLKLRALPPAIDEAKAPIVTSTSRSPNLEGKDIKTLKNEKQPSSAKQMACVVAYYLTEIAPENEKKRTVNASDLEKYFKQAGYPQVKMDQLLIDCKKSGYLESEARGEYTLNRVGYNLVAHQLPKKTAE
jgi:hypothetical protein